MGAIRAETYLDEALADIEGQTNFRGNEHKPQYRGRKNTGFGWGIPDNLTHAKVARERKPSAEASKPAAPTVPTKPQPECAADVVLIHGNTRDFAAFRIVEDYDALCEALSDRVEDIEATRLGVDAAGRFASGHASTLLCKPQIKHYGPTSLKKMLDATGLVMVLAIDDEKFSKVRERLGKRERPFRSTARKPHAMNGKP